MLRIEPSGGTLGARVTGVDLSHPLSDDHFATILRALPEHGVLCFPNQKLDSRAQRDFSLRFGNIQKSITGRFRDPEVPEVGFLSNVVENGQPIGLADAGQDWHTDMSYNQTVGFVNVLFAVKVPRRGGKVLGGTQFANMRAAYDALPDETKARLEGLTATHDFNKFWDNMRGREGSKRPELTAEQRASRPLSVHPVVLTHPISGQRTLYCNPGYAVRINELDKAESDALLEELFEHQLQPQFLHTHVWTEGDLLIWDHLSTLHNAVADYGPEEHRLMKRCQVMADRVFDPAFLQAALGARTAAQWTAAQ